MTIHSSVRTWNNDHARWCCLINIHKPIGRAFRGDSVVVVEPLYVACGGILNDDGDHTTDKQSTFHYLVRSQVQNHNRL